MSTSFQLPLGRTPQHREGPAVTARTAPGVLSRIVNATKFPSLADAWTKSSQGREADAIAWCAIALVAIVRIAFLHPPCLLRQNPESRVTCAGR